MEKFRKFDDPSCGVNPFVPWKEESRPLWMKPFRAIIVVFLFLIKLPFLILMLLGLFMVTVMKNFLFNRTLVFYFEWFMNMCFCKIILQALGFSSIKTDKHADQSSFDFFKKTIQKKQGDKGNAKDTEKINAGDLILSTKSCLVEVLYLAMTYNPIFTKVDIDEKGEAGIRRIQGKELINFAIGIQMPERTKQPVYSDFVKFRDSQADKDLRPIVVFPEGTHSNGRGILQFEDKIYKMIIRAAEWQQVATHCIRFDYGKFTYCSVYNTTDVKGYWHALTLLTQFINHVTVITYKNFDQDLPDKRGDDNKIELIAHSLSTKGKNYALKVGHKDHKKFMEYWNDTTDTKNYKKE